MDVPQSLVMDVGERPGQVFRHTADRSKAARLLGWAPRVSLREGLGRTIDYYRRHRDRYL